MNCILETKNKNKKNPKTIYVLRLCSMLRIYKYRRYGPCPGISFFIFCAGKKKIRMPISLRLVTNLFNFVHSLEQNL